MELPPFYQRLKPFRPAFETSLPILCYHKLGPLPAGVKLAGLYVSADLFARQLTELHEAGFATPPMRTIANGEHQPGRIVLSFDDGFRNVLQHGLRALEASQLHAIQFLVSDLIGRTNEWEQAEGEVREPLMGPSEIREWLSAGHEIGSHSCTHPHLSRLPLPQAREEIVASKRKLEDQFGCPVEHFCYPYGDWNESLTELVREAGYLTACTSDFGVNTAATPPFAMKRLLARRPSRRLSLWIRQVTGLNWSSRQFVQALRRRVRLGR